MCNSHKVGMGKDSTPLFAIKGLKQKTGSKPVLVVSKKVSPKAVDRNKVKRLLREAILTIEKKQEKKLLNITIRCFPSIQKANFESIVKELEGYIEKNKI